MGKGYSKVGGFLSRLSTPICCCQAVFDQGEEIAVFQCSGHSLLVIELFIDWVKDERGITTNAEETYPHAGCYVYLP